MRISDWSSDVCSSDPPVQKLAAHEVPPAQRSEAVVGQLAQARMVARPLVERHAEAVLLLGDHLLRQEVAERFLEERSQADVLELELGRNGGAEGDEPVLEEGRAEERRVGKAGRSTC